MLCFVASLLGGRFAPLGSFSHVYCCLIASILVGRSLLVAPRWLLLVGRSSSVAHRAVIIPTSNSLHRQQQVCPNQCNWVNEQGHCDKSTGSCVCYPPFTGPDCGTRTDGSNTDIKGACICYDNADLTGCNFEYLEPEDEMGGTQLQSSLSMGCAFLAAAMTMLMIM